MKRITGVLLICVALVVAGRGVAAETIHLKNGSVLRGRVIGQSRTQIRLQTDAGVRTIEKSDVRRISYESADELRRQQAEAERRKQAEAERKRQEEAQLKREREAAERAREEAARQAREEAARKAAQEAQDAADVEGPSGLSYRGFALRNAVLPGWGFFAADRPIWGAVYGTLTAGALYYTYTSRQTALAAKSENFQQVQLNTLLTLAPGAFDTGSRLALGVLANQTAYGPYQSKVDAHNQSLRLFGVIYAVQMIHTAALARGWPAPGQVSVTLPESGAEFAMGLLAPRVGVDFMPAAEAQLGAELRFYF